MSELQRLYQRLAKSRLSDLCGPDSYRDPDSNSNPLPHKLVKGIFILIADSYVHFTDLQ